MALEIVWTQEAKAALAEIITSLEEYQDDRLLRRFSQQLDKKLVLVKQHPQMYQKSDRLEGARRCVIDTYYSFLYSHDSIFIYILTLYDNRRRPK